MTWPYWPKMGNARTCVNDVAGAWSNSSILIQTHVSAARLILIGLICASPAILLIDGLIADGLLAGVAAAGLAITARALHPGETEFLVSVIRFPLAVAALPALWMLIQVLPIPGLAHPFWASAAAALGHPIAGTISIDPGASIIALGQYVCMIALAYLSAAVAVDRHRAESILFALTGASATVALIVIAHHSIVLRVDIARSIQAQATTCAVMGAIIASAACIRSVEKYKRRHSNPNRAVPMLLGTIALCGAALAICLGASILGETTGVSFALGCGLAAVASVLIIRHLDLGPFGITAFGVMALVIGFFIVASHPVERGAGLPLMYASSKSSSLIALSERVLHDTPIAGSGAGTFASLAPIYREMDDPAVGSVASTTAATLGIEMGMPILWLIAAVTVSAIIVLLRSALQRGRDWFYPAMGGSCLITLLILAFINAGLLGTVASLIAAAAIGLATAQSKSRMERS